MFGSPADAIIASVMGPGRIAWCVLGSRARGHGVRKSSYVERPIRSRSDGPNHPT